MYSLNSLQQHSSICNGGLVSMIHDRPWAPPC
jgi:hypothetical protein